MDPAATAAGIFTAYATVFAAYSLYGLLAAPIAFVLLVFVALGALILSLAHGSLIAGLGIIGAYGVPIIVSTGSHEAWALLPYLVFVAAGALAVVRYRNWWKLAWLNLAGAAIWPRWTVCFARSRFPPKAAGPAETL